MPNVQIAFPTPMDMTVRTIHADIACADHSSTQQSCGSAPEGNVRAVAMKEAHIESRLLLILTTSKRL